MTTSGAYNASTFNRDLEGEIKRLRDQVLVSWQKEARTLKWFGLQDGMSVLELGSGPGFYTEQLLEMLPNSSITALEIDPVLIKNAEQYLQDKGGERLRFVEASIVETGLPDDSFDFAIARLLFRHLPDAVAAAKEVRRVLKPGGQLVVIDADSELIGITDPPILEYQALREKGQQIQTTRGTNRKIGRQLWRILKEAGFQNLDLEAVISHSDDRGIEAFKHTLDVGLALPAVKLGLLSEQDIESLVAAGEKFLASPNAFILVLWLMACGEKNRS